MKSDGSAWGWGINSYGQLGYTSGLGLEKSPRQITSLSSVSAMAGGVDHSLALKSNGTVWAAGRNNRGQLGNGTTTNSSTHVQVSNLSGASDIAAGSAHNLALKSDGTVWAWGYNQYGQLGDNTTKDRKTPVQVVGLSGVTAIAAGGNHSLAVKNDGTVRAWGYNQYGQLGDNSTRDRRTPVQVTGLSGATGVAAGGNHSLARKGDGTVRSWGYNYYGQLGDGTNTNRLTPVSVTGLGGVAVIAAGGNHSLGSKGDGSAWAWGYNGYGQLGDNSTTDRNSPMQVAGVGEVTALGAGGNHTLTATMHRVTTYYYDRLYRLTSASRFETGWSYDYDPVGNRTSDTHDQLPTSYSYDRADRIQQAGSVTYTLNANGNLVARGADSFGYDQANRLKNATIAAVTSSYVYNGDGVRASKTMSSTTTSYVYDVNRSLPVVLDDGSRKYVWGLGLAYSVGTTGTVEIYYSDGLGSVRAIANANGEVVQTYRYDPFGVLESVEGNVTQPFQYTGEQRDGESGFYYLRARVYDPAIGRFLGRDPLRGSLELPQTLNRYAYATNNPVLLTDPSGLLVIPPRSLSELLKTCSRPRFLGRFWPVWQVKTLEFVEVLRDFGESQTDS